MKLLIFIILIQTIYGSCEYCATSKCDGPPYYKCSQCVTNYISVDGYCRTCSNFCFDCSNGICQQCPDGFFGDSSLCQSCSGNCYKCTSYDNCTKCYAFAYSYVQGSQTLCNSCDINCETCENSSTYCTSCQDGYLLQSGNYCQRCTSPCGQCQNQLYYCTTCVSNQYYLIGKQCLPCQAPCVLCYTETKCYQCSDSYYLNSQGSCSKCKEPCYQCISENLCLSCVDSLHYYLAGTECLSCNQMDPNCITCNEGHKCTSCQDGYYVMKIGTIASNVPQQSNCQKCASQCLTCYGDKSECISCVDNSFLPPFCRSICSNGFFEFGLDCLACDSQCATCIQGSSNCLTCSTNRVSPPTCNCDIGYFEKTKTCNQCLNVCESCLDDVSCTKCKSPNFLQNGLCVSQCGVGYYQRYNDLSCILCNINNCQQCSTHGICNVCETNYLLYRNQCFQQTCQEGQYTIDNLTCLNCNQNCKNCLTTPENCVNCVTGSYLLQTSNDSICVAECPYNYYILNQQCTICDSNCQSCTNYSICLTCKIGQNLYNQRCVVNCPTSYYSIDQQCRQCPTNCLTCFDKKCLTCSQQTILYQDSCLSNCPEGLYLDNNECYPCNKICKTCENSQDCLSCDSSLYLYNNTCLGSCLTSQYRDLADNKCKNCIDGCEICANNYSCYQCLPNYAALKNICVNNCDEGYYVEASYCRECHIYCKTCQGPTEYDCLTCKNNLLRYKTMCVLECPSMTVLINTVCKECYQTCQTCSDSGQYDCIQCKTDYVLLNGGCFSNCPSQYYKNQQQCIKCQNNCGICINNLSCIRCLNNFYYDTQNCISQCQDGYYGYDGLCEKCHTSCLTCNGRLSTNCLTCAQPLVLNQNECLQGCFNQFYQTANYQCGLCKTECQLCDNDTECTYCPQNTYFKDKTCIDQCPDGYMNNYRYRRCDQCTDGCKTCFGISNNQCLTCFDPNLFYKNQCYSQCPDKTFENQGFCYNCPDNCQKCTQSSICDQCDSAYVFYNQVCTQKCPEGYYEDYGNQSCASCLANCRICLNGFSCLVCYNTYDNGVSTDYFLSNNQCVATCPNYVNKINFQYCVPCQQAVNYYYSYKCINDYEPVHIVNNQAVLCQYDTTTYPDLWLNKCSKCDTSCTKCYGIGPNQCIICKYDGNNLDYCIPNCPLYGATLYKENGIYVCKNCPFSCNYCTSQNTHSCDVCQDGYLTYDSNKNTFNCVNYCDTGYTAYKSGLQCQKCNPTLNCQNCKYVDQCTSCNPPKVLYNSQCISNCPSNYYLSDRDNACYPCKNSCSTCSDGVSCILPTTSYSQILVVQDSQVYANCDDGYYLDGSICQKCLSNCVRCTDNSSCSACDGNLHIMFNGQCIDKCPNKTYFNSGQCINCDTSCLTCFDNYDSQCLSCSSDLWFQILYSTTDAAYYSYCKSSCPSNYVQDTITNRCLYQNCVSSCLTCLADQPFYCITCQTGQVLQLILTAQGYVSYGYCEAQCQSDYYLQDGKCYLCNRLCQACIDNTTYCSVCSSQAYRLNNQQCVTQCPIGYLTNPNTKTCDQCVNCQECVLHQSVNTCVVQQISCNYARVYLHQNYCKPCHWSCYTCYGPDFNNCYSCTTTDYYTSYPSYVSETRYLYLNQCLLYCPQGTTVAYDQITCIDCASNCETCIYTTINECKSCVVGYYLLDISCVENCGYRYHQNYYQQICEPCFTGCYTCYGPGTEQCLSCDPSYLLSNQKCLPYCPFKYYYNLFTRDCEYCDALIADNYCVIKCPPQYYQENNMCFQCSNQCTSCAQGFYLHLNTCVQNCPEGYYNIIQECQKCDQQCLSCVNKSDNCIICANTSRSNPPICGCSINYQQDSTDAQCIQCDQKCRSCSQYYNNCLICSPDRNQNPPYCTCPIGTYDNGANCIQCKHECDDCLSDSLCLHCRGDRTGRNCLCRIGMYDDYTNQYCQNCDFSCSTCTKNGCTLCKGNRQISINDQCLCPIGYYEDDKSINCPKCVFICQTCTQNEFNCQICLGDRKNPPQCTCDDGYFDDEVNLNCQKCLKECVTCNKASCLICKTNRFGSVCDCPPGGIDRQDVGYMECETCDLGTPIIKLQNDLITLIIEFGKQVKFSEDEGCSQIYQIDQLGVDPECGVDDQYRITITLGANNKIEIGQTIQLLTNIIGLDCDEPFKQILPTTILPPQIIPSSDVYILGPPLTTKCQEVTFYVGQYFNDARNGFKMIQWSLNSQVPSPTNEHLQGILSEANLYKKVSVTIPPNVLQEDITYSFKYEFVNYLGQTQYKIYTLKCVSSQLPLISLQYSDQQPLVYYINNRISFKAIFKSQPSCDSEPVDTDVYYKVYLTTIIGNPIHESDYSYKSLSEIDVDIIIEPYSFIDEGNFYIVVSGSHDKQNSINASLTIKMFKPGIYAKILGGNQVHSYSRSFNLDAIVKDLNIPTSQSKGFDFEWNCHNSEKDEECKQTNGEVYTFSNKATQIISKQSLSPFNNYVFTVTASKGNEQVSFSATITIVDVEIEVLNIDTPNIALNSEILFNQELDFTMTSYYQMMQGAIIYDYQQIANFKIQFKNFMIVLQNLMDQYQNKVTLRIIAFDSNYFTPLLTNINIGILQPPLNCKFQVSSIIGFAYQTRFGLSVSNCIDVNQPLLYRFQYYFNQTDYEIDFQKGDFQNVELLIDYQISPSFDTILPSSSLSRSILIATVRNSLGAEVNITQTVVVGRDDEDLKTKSKQIIYESKIQQMKELYKKRILQENIKLLNQIFSDSGSLQTDKRVSILSILSIGVLTNLPSDETLRVSILNQLNLDIEIPFLTDTTKTQIQKSISRLMGNLTLSDFQAINVYLNRIQATLTNCINQINSLTNLIYLNQAGYRDYQQRKLNFYKILSNSYPLDMILNSQIESFFTQYEGNVSLMNSSTLNTMKQNNQQFLNLIQLLKDGALTYQQINSDPIVLNRKAFQLTLNRLTPDYLLYYTSKVDLTVRFGENTSQLRSDVVLNFSHINYVKNPYILDQNYPQTIFYSNIQSYEPILPNGSLFKPQQPFTTQYKVNKYRTRILQEYQDLYMLDEQPYEVNYACANKYLQYWQSDFCSIQLSGFDTNGNEIYDCSCNVMGPTTVGTLLSDILQVEKFQKAFSTEALLALLNFPFHRSIIVYCLAVFTAMLIISLPYGFKKDQMDKERQMPIHMIESEYIRKLFEERQQELVQKRKEQRQNKVKTTKKDYQLIQAEEVQKQNTQDDQQIQEVVIEPDIDPDEAIERIHNAEDDSQCYSGQSNGDQMIDQIGHEQNGDFHTLGGPNNQQQNTCNNTSFHVIRLQMESQNQNSQAQSDHFINTENQQKALISKGLKNKQLMTSSQGKPSGHVQFSSSSSVEANEDQILEQPFQISSQSQNSNNKLMNSSKLPLSSLKTHIFNDDEHDIGDEFTLEEKEAIVQIWYLEKKRKKLLEDGFQLKFTLQNLLTFLSLFQSILSVFYIFDKLMPRPIRFCLIYITIITTCYINIFFQVNLNPTSTIAYSILSSVLSVLEIFILTIMMPNRFLIIRIIGWLAFVALIAIFIYLILVSMALEADESQGDISRSNEWGINFIISFFTTHCITDPLQLIFFFKIIQISFNKEHSILRKIFIWLCLNKHFNVFFDFLDS